jgi:acyl carrier protein
LRKKSFPQQPNIILFCGIIRLPEVCEEGLMDNHDNSPYYRVIAIVQRIIKDRAISFHSPIHTEHGLIEIGLTSLDLARLVLLVEDEFDLEIPTNDITPANFRSISTVSQLVNRLVGL